MIEHEVYITRDGLGRGSIIERADQLFQIFIHWKWDEETRKAFNVAEGMNSTWYQNSTTADDLYGNSDPQPGLYASVEDAREELLSIPAFRNSQLQ